MKLPDPEAGLVISYSYLWSHEHQRGETEGRKNRPCVIVLAAASQEQETKKVTVVPITHIPPEDDERAIEIPSKVKEHLQLDSERSWIILNDFNVFTWPGYDLRSIAGKSRSYVYGFLPPRFFEEMISKIIQLRHKMKISSRDEVA